MNTSEYGSAVAATPAASPASFSVIGFPFGILSGSSSGVLGRSAAAMRAILAM
jgi:hypothetical protein